MFTDVYAAGLLGIMVIVPLHVDVKEKRWVVFKGEEDPTSIPVEWICWLNGQRKKAPTLEEMMELEAKRERVRLNVALLRKEEEERRSKEGIRPRATSTGKVGGPDLRSFIQQFPADSKGDTVGETSGAMDGMRNSEESETDKEVPSEQKRQPESSEPTGTGASFRPGTWQPPT
ncbi:uncharacterized protein LOC131330489 isoform X2 [Rhododendron vialii]|uniref:uncharacterized protein LOC131330489 isoform X2 n=1 Tax=Rhododendron vialii TaxID=182163 RepID=UPI00265E5EE9|nr:uncharacterized protein LOC131330489 isoform X2 [Rhododendron vialii]